MNDSGFIPRTPKYNQTVYAYLRKRLVDESERTLDKYSILFRDLKDKNTLSLALIESILTTLDVVRYEDWDKDNTTFSKEFYRPYRREDEDR